ncbi:MULTISPECIES: aspartyl-phosphate phosphatase Spo0E family protein [Halobacillus]|uniref:Aspartyl-phosphate phosphatase Spo0E family protein n=2 Tax=Halobacillus TaxID=45667 RepID=A0A3E0JDK7_9BACI|nr:MULTISPECIES: aspartyl-phosphate phosphatase Spo0E family protein [Halobacillus]RDY70675.1 aspartyl-phosphate phosphatase Spo0E family protein [Halobacillus trueperi]REJ11026.1 aspartyl-phosphate phosphatase Spo0E family protein [Halobacillus trueperi]SDO00086.1 Spo0E like sporulation regulatory protein [Halobacillus aidingensis]
MPTILCLENRIESVREQLYQAYLDSVEYSELVKISQELDQLLNQLDSLKRR